MLYNHVFSTQIETFIQILRKNIRNNLLNCCIMKISIRAAQNKQRGCQFDMPAVNPCLSGIRQLNQIYFSLTQVL